jgi:lipid II:glycine glycyltransferase (peptidoglycan interpeptide bridge formation enzyme)
MLKEILTAVAEYLDSFKFSLISFSLNQDIVDTQPFIWRKFKVNPRYTYIIDLMQPIEEILKNMSAERRNEIRKALRDGIKVEKVNELGIIKNLVGKTYKRQGENIPYEMFLDKILFEFADETNSFAFVSFLNEQPIAGVFCVHDKEIAYLLVSGYDHGAKHRGAGALATLEAIKYSKEKGLKLFDFEGSMVPQIEFFYREFGGEPTPVFRVSKANILLEFILKFVKREIF